MTTLSRDAKVRLRWIIHYKKFRNARLTCRHFGISPDTFYHWKRKFNPKNPASLEDNTSNRRPKVLRGKSWTRELLRALIGLRKQHPKFGTYRLAILLKKEGFSISPSTVGRISTSIKSGLTPIKSGLTSKGK